MERSAEVASQVGGGPSIPNDPKADTTPTREVRRAPETPDTPPTILLVDDDQDACDLFGYLLEDAGYQVMTAGTGKSALSTIADAAIDLVLLDITLPDQSGLEVLRAIRQRHSALELPVIMATGCSQSSMMVDALREGANDYVTKPFDIPVTLARVASHLETRQQSRVVEGPSLDRLGVGSEFNGYRLFEKIGSGGFAYIYKALQMSTGQHVAIKIMRPGLDSDQYRRFDREVQVLAQLRHAHIVRLIDSGALRLSMRQSSPGENIEFTPSPKSNGEQQPYFVMEYLQGETLASLLKRSGRLTAETAVDLLLPVISASAAAHARGVIHRDLKPSNIFICQGMGAAHPVVLDFGIAKLIGEYSSLTQSGSFVGTPGYLAPEQVAGKPVDEMADQYALGIMLYECITGKRAYDRALPMLEIMMSISRGELTPIEQLAPETDVALRQVIQRAIALVPEQRFATVSELGNALLPFASPYAGEQWRYSLPCTEARVGAKNVSAESVAPTQLVTRGDALTKASLKGGR